METPAHPSQHNPHSPICICSACVNRQKTLLTKEPNTDYPDCEDCYLSWDFVMREYLNHYCPTHKPSPKADPRKATPETEYAFTLTMPPSYSPKKPIEEAARLIMENGITNKPYEKADKWAIVLEHTENGTPHVHGVYRTPSGRRIATKYFKRYWDLWDEKIKLGHGHKGGYHAKARHTESYDAYLEKEGVVSRNKTRSPGTSVSQDSDSDDLISHV